MTGQQRFADTAWIGRLANRVRVSYQAHHSSQLVVASTTRGEMRSW